jgi:hypothetical protein
MDPKPAFQKKPWISPNGKVGWKSWTRINPKPQFSAGHSNVWVAIYVNTLAKESYRKAQASYPPCAKIVKASYKDRENTQFVDLTAMFKMPAG